MPICARLLPQTTPLPAAPSRGYPGLFVQLSKRHRFQPRRVGGNSAACCVCSRNVIGTRPGEADTADALCRADADGDGVPDRAAGGNLHRGMRDAPERAWPCIARFPLGIRLTKQRRWLGCRDTLRVDVGYRHGRSGSCRAAATASARARCAWQRVIDCCTVMRSCATDHRSRASGRVISIPGSRRSSSSDSEIERV